MVERRAAKKLTKEFIASWKGPVWYVSHLVVPNPHSLTTPVRLVWNSSQKFRGVRMNDLLLKGPDVLNPIRAILLRFRRGVHAATLRKCTILCGWKTWRCTSTDFSGEILRKRLKSMRSPESTLAIDQQGALRNWL
jgi:hypothetical protein